MSIGDPPAKTSSAACTIMRLPANVIRLLKVQETGLLLVILSLGVLLAVCGGSIVREIPPASGHYYKVSVFLQRDNLLGLLNVTSWFAIMAVGATMVIISGGIDLSVGSVFCLAGVCGAMTAHAFGPNGPWPEAPAACAMAATVGVTLLTGAVCGLLNGVMIVLLRVHPFIITLGTMAIFRTTAFLLTRGQSVAEFAPGFRAMFKDRLRVGSEPLLPLLVMAAVAIVGFVYLRFSVAGRRNLAVGGNEEASRYSGLRVGRIKTSVYVIAGLTAGLAAAVNIGYWGSAQSGDGTGYELIVIASAVVGGASLAGGRGSAIGAMLGAIVIKLIENGTVVLGLKSEVSPMVFGAVIIVAVVFDQVKAGISRRQALQGSAAVPGLCDEGPAARSPKP